VGSEKTVQFLESALGENNESSEVTTWGKLDDVKSSDVANINTWEVSSGSSDVGALITVDDEWSLLHDVSRVSVFTSSGSQLLVVSNSAKIIIESDFVKGFKELFGVGGVEAVKNKWELWNILNGVTSGHNEWSNS